MFHVDGFTLSFSEVWHKGVPFLKFGILFNYFSPTLKSAVRLSDLRFLFLNIWEIFMNSDVVLSIFRLFKALPKAKTQQQNQDLNKTAITYGIFISPDVDFELIYKYNLIDEIPAYGITSNQMNQCLHKSLAKVKNASE